MMSKKLTEMSLKELWRLFPIYLTEHNDDWVRWYDSEAEYLSDILPMHVKGISHIGCEFLYKPRIMGTYEHLKSLKAPYMERKPMKWGFLSLKSMETTLNFNGN